jgi:hypothetical protein
VLPADPSEYVIAAAHHIETRVLRRRSLPLDEIAFRLRPELIPALDHALALLQEAGRLSHDGRRYTLAHPRRPRARRVDQLDLFSELPGRQTGGGDP